MSSSILVVRLNRAEAKYKKSKVYSHHAPSLYIAGLLTLLRKEGLPATFLDSFYEKEIYSLMEEVSSRDAVETLLIDYEVCEQERLRHWLEANARNYRQVFLVGKSATFFEYPDPLPANTELIKGDYEHAVIERMTGGKGKGRSRKRLKLSDFPPTDFSLIDKYPYGYLYPVKVKGRKAFGFLEATRGCVNACRFCHVLCRTSLEKGYQAKKVETVIAELKILKGLGKNVVAFEDDNLLQDKNFALELLKEMDRQRIDMAYLIQCRANSLDDELMFWLKRTNCSTVCIGFESGSQRILDLQKKEITPAQMVEVAGLLRRYGIRIVGYFIMGFPGETVEDLEKTRRLIHALPLDFMQLHFYSQRDAYNKYVPEARIDPDVMRYYRKTVLGYYLSSGYVKRYLAQCLRYNISDWGNELGVLWAFVRFQVTDR